ncbi:MAG: phosphoribosyl-ATP diphosphatase, partial [Candidatus Oleimicrobiaceae bacterium]
VVPGSLMPWLGLSEEQVRAKLLEEAEELVRAGSPQEVVWEAADVLYFLTVLLAREKVTVEEVLRELRRRRLATRRAEGSSREESCA